MNPQAAPVIHSEDRAGEGRQLDCRYVNHCLKTVVKHKWENWHCRDCQSYAQLTKDEQRRDLEGMTLLYREIHKYQRRWCGEG